MVIMYRGVPAPIDQVPPADLTPAQYIMGWDDRGLTATTIQARREADVRRGHDIQRQVRQILQDQIDHLFYICLVGGNEAIDTRITATDVHYRAGARMIHTPRQIQPLGAEFVPGRECLTFNYNRSSDDVDDQECWISLDHTDNRGITYIDAMRVITRLRGDEHPYSRSTQLANDLIKAYNDRDQDKSPELKRDWLYEEIQELPEKEGMISKAAVIAILGSKLAVQNQADTSVDCQNA